MEKKTIIISAIVLILIVIAVFFLGGMSNKGGEAVNNNQEQQGNTEQNQPENTESTTLRTKILELVGKANEGKNEEALAGYLELEKDNPNDLMLLNNIADIYSDMANWEKSEEYYKKVLAAHPDYINGYRMLAYLYQYRFNDNEEKIKTLIDSGLANNNNDVSLLNWIINYYTEKGDEDKALPYKTLLEQLNNK
jgi:tetratricopeptide (TPR) repeat protein